MTRTYTDWEHSVQATMHEDARVQDDITALANELRNHWEDWKSESPYNTWEQCIKQELDLSAGALRKRNHDARKVATVTDVTVAKPQPSRQTVKPASPAEIERRRNHAASLWQEGHTAEAIAPILGVSRRTIQVDLAAKGAEGRRPPANKPIEIPDNDYHWRNQDLGIADDESTIEQSSFASCETPSATEAIEDVRVQLSLILGSRYRLSLKDRNNLITVLNNALERLHNGNQETQGTSQSSRIAG